MGGGDIILEITGGGICMKIEELRELREFLVGNDASFSSIQDIFNCLDVTDEEGVKYLIGLQKYLRQNHISFDKIQKEFESVDWELEDMRDLMFNKLEEVVDLKESLQCLKKKKKFGNILAVCVPLPLLGAEIDSPNGLYFLLFSMFLCYGFASNFNYKQDMKETTRLLAKKEKEFQKVKDEYHLLRECRNPKLSE